MRLRVWAAAAVLVAAVGCGSSNTVETPKNPVQELSPPPTSGPPGVLIKK
jgi:hypothetical protein